MDLDRVFKSLADPTRRELLDRLHERDGQSLTDLCGQLDMSRQAVTKHLALLVEAELVVTVRRGREKLHHINALPIIEIDEQWFSKYKADRQRARGRRKGELPVKKGR